MKIAIIGAGFTGLSAAHQLVKKGHRITIFERDENPGGLALGFRQKDWQWSLEKHYHHWFTNDDCILTLAKELRYEVFIERPKTSVYVDNTIFPFDSPHDILVFPKLTLYERLRMGLALGILKINPMWQPLEHAKAADALPKIIGNRAYKMLWEPLLHNKFGEYANEVSLAWFWARIRKRTARLAYPKGGFLAFANALVKIIEQNGGTVVFNTSVTEIKTSEEKGVRVVCSRSSLFFDKVIVTLPSFFFSKIAPQLPDEYKERLSQLKGLGAVNLILRLEKSFLTDGTYWLSICDKKSPIMAIVEHTNFMDKKYYNNEHIVYIGNYLPADHPYMKMDANELLKIYDPYLRKINPSYQLSIVNCQLFTVPFAQPIIPLNYSKIIPPFKTPLPNVYLANIQQVYPWDRGTNYAVELGEKVAALIANQ